MTLLLGFCLYLVFVYVPFDLFWKQLASDREVWFGLVLRGWWAKATAPIHWLIYAAGAYGFWKMRPWMWPWAFLYSAYVTASMTVHYAVHGGWLWPVVVAAAVTVALGAGGSRHFRPLRPAAGASTGRSERAP